MIRNSLKLTIFIDPKWIGGPPDAPHEEKEKGKEVAGRSQRPWPKFQGKHLLFNQFNRMEELGCPLLGLTHFVDMLKIEWFTPLLRFSCFSVWRRPLRSFWGDVMTFRDDFGIFQHVLSMLCLVEMRLSSYSASFCDTLTRVYETWLRIRHLLVGWERKKQINSLHFVIHIHIIY